MITGAALCVISQKLEIPKMSINWWTDKQNVAHTFKGMLFGHKEEWNTDTCYNMNEPQRHYAKWKKPDIKDHILYDSIYMKYPE